MNERDFSELAAGHALGALSAEDDVAFRSALAEHPEWSALVDADLDTVARLADAVGEVAPPASIKSALFAMLDEPTRAPQTVDAAASGNALPDVTAGPASAATTRATAAEPAATSSTDSSSKATSAPRRAGLRSRTWFALAASIALVLGVGVGASVIAQATRPAAIIALDRIEGASDARQATAPVEGGGNATLHWSADLGEAVLVSDGLPSIASDETFELWYVRGETPISAGTFDASDDGATAALQSEPQEGDIVAVTVEQAGGAPNGLPTTTPIVLIPTA